MKSCISITLLFLLLAGGGCDSGSKLTDETGDVPAEAIPQEDLEETRKAIQALEALGAKVEYDPERLNVYRVDLSGKDIQDTDLAHLALFGTLMDLDLSGTKITDQGLSHLASLPELGFIYLSRTAISDEGLKQLAKLPKLESLILDSTKITDEGLVHLSEMPELAILNLDSTAVTDQGLEHLKAVEKLRTLSLTLTEVSDAAITAFEEAKPNCRIGRRQF